MKFFVTYFSETVRLRRLKLGTQVGNGQMYRVYRNQAASAYSSLYCFIFLSLKFSNIKIFRHTFLRNCETYKIETWYTHGQLADVSCIFVPLFLHFSLSSFLTLKIFVTLFSGNVRSRRLKLGSHVDCGQVYRIYWNQAAATYSFLYFSFFLSNFPTIFVTLFSGSVGPRRLKLVTHMENGCRYRVYRNHAAALIRPFVFCVFFFIFLSLQFSNIKIFSSHFSQEL